MKNILKKWLGVTKLEEQVDKKHSQILCLQESNNILEREVEEWQKIFGGATVSADIDLCGSSWAVISLPHGKSHYLKFVDFSRSEADDIIKILRYLDKKTRGGVYVDCPPNMRGIIKSEMFR